MSDVLSLAVWYDTENLKAAVWNASAAILGDSYKSRYRLEGEIASHLERHLTTKPSVKTSWVSAKLVISVWKACGGKNPGTKYDLAAKAILARVLHPKGCSCTRCKGAKHLSGCECAGNGRCSKPAK